MNNSMFDLKRLNVDRNVKIIEEYYNTHYKKMFLPPSGDLFYEKKLPDEYYDDEYDYYESKNYTKKDIFLYNLPVPLELISSLNLETDNNKYKYLYIRLNNMAYSRTKELKDTNLVNQLLIDLACKYKIYFSFLNVIKSIEYNEIVSKSFGLANFCTEWLICIDANNINVIYEEFNQLKFEENSNIFTEIQKDSLYFFEKKYFLNMNWDENYIYFDTVYFFSFCYEKELDDYLCLGYHSSRADSSYLVHESFIRYVLSYMKKNYNMGEEEYLELTDKEVEDYPDYAKYNYVYLPKAN